MSLLGGCKHAVAFLFWLHRRSSEPSVTEAQYYWTATKLSKVGKGFTVTVATLGRKQPLPLENVVENVDEITIVSRTQSR